MSCDERKKLLENHLQMLAERAKTADGFWLIALTDRMIEIEKCIKKISEWAYSHEKW